MGYETGWASGRKLLLAVLGLAAGGTFLLMAWPLWQDEPPQRDAASQEFAPPALSGSRFLNAQQEVPYVGSDRCIQCHPDQHRSYLATFHSRSMSIVEPGAEPPDGTVEHTASDRQYTVRRGGDDLWHAESIVLSEGAPLELQAHALRYRIGSGHFGRSYLAEADGFLVQSPVTWYTPRQEWDMSPGYDGAHQSSFQRTVSTECLFCHAGQFEATGANPHKPRIHELAIGCERCHGPGALHVERWTSRESPRGEHDDTIVHPRRLSRDLSEAICAQCHLQGDMQIAVRGRALDQFRPGLPLEDFRYEFRMQSAGEEMTIVGHVEQLHASRCYQASQTLTCITCHDPHQPVAPEYRDVAGRETCLTCHQVDSCGLDAVTRHRRAEDRCVDCHMPKSKTEVPHVAFTHHRIGVHAGRELERSTQEGLVTEQDLSRLPSLERDRILGLAHWSFYRDRMDDPRRDWCAVQGARLLKDVADAGVRDADVDWALAEIASAQGDRPAALRLAERIVDTESHATDERTQALRLLYSVRFREHRFEEAHVLLEELVSVRRNAEDWFYLGLTRQNLGRTDEAIDALEQSLSIDPAQTGSHTALAALHYSRGDKERADFHRARAVRFSQPR